MGGINTLFLTLVGHESKGALLEVLRFSFGKDRQNQIVGCRLDQELRSRSKCTGVTCQNRFTNQPGLESRYSGVSLFYKPGADPFQTHPPKTVIASAQPFPQTRSVKLLKLDLETLDGQYNSLSDHMAKGEQEDFNPASAGCKLSNLSQCCETFKHI